MEKLTPEQYLKKKTEVVPGKKISPEEYLAQKNTTKDTRVATEKVQTPEEYLANKQKTTTVPKSTLSKVGSFVKPIAQDIYKTAATIPVRTAQAAASIVGATTPENRTKAFEFASQPVNIGFGVQVNPLDTSSAGRAAQQTAGDFLKTASLTPIGKGLTLAKQLALQGGTYGLGNAMSEGKSAVDTVKETAIGTVGGLVLGKGLSVAGKLLKGAPKEVPTATTPEVPISAAIPEVTPTKVQQSVPKQVSYTKDPVQSLTKVMETELPPNADPTFVSTTMKDQVAKYNSAASVIPTDDLIDMSMGLKPTPAGLNPVTIFQLTADRADLTVEQAMRLKNIYPLSQAGQDLSLARLKSGAVIDNPIDMMQSVEKELKQQVVKKGINKTDIKNLFPDCGFN